MSGIEIGVNVDADSVRADGNDSANGGNATFFLLMESGDALLMETGDKLLREDAA